MNHLLKEQTRVPALMAAAVAVDDFAALALAFRVGFAMLRWLLIRDGQIDQIAVLMNPDVFDGL